MSGSDGAVVGRVLGQVAVMSTLGGQVAVRRIWDGQNCTVSLPWGARCSPWGAGFAQGSAWGHWDAARPQHQGSSSSMCLQDAASGRHFFAHECSWRTPAREHTCVCVLQEGQSQRGDAGVSGERMGGQAAGAGGGTGTCWPPGKSSAPALRLCVKQDQPLP